MDLDYKARDILRTGHRCNNVWEIASILEKRSQPFFTTNDLGRIMQNWPTVGGYSQDLHFSTLSDLLNLDISFT